jgi:dUTP pyrophosphatase
METTQVSKIEAIGDASKNIRSKRAEEQIEQRVSEQAEKEWNLSTKTADKLTVTGSLAWRQRGFEVVDDAHRKHPNVKIILPRRSDHRSVGYDFVSPVDLVLQPNEQQLIWSDVKAYMQSNEVLLLNVRSSHGKPRIQLANTQGWIDSSYYNNPKNNGNIGLFLRNEGDAPYEIKKGDKIVQGMFTPYLTTDDDDPEHNDRIGGFGSNGKQKRNEVN